MPKEKFLGMTWTRLSGSFHVVLSSIPKIRQIRDGRMFGVLIDNPKVKQSGLFRLRPQNPQTANLGTKEQMSTAAALF